MKIGVLGTGMVGRAIATKLAQRGHAVTMGSRERGNAKAREWLSVAGANAAEGSFADAAAHGEIVFNCTNGSATLAVLEQAGHANLRGKILVDVANPLEFKPGAPPTLFVFNDDSLGEQVQRAIPDAKVVKTLNTVNASVMVEPARIAGDHDVFLSGNDAGAKKTVAAILTDDFGWKHVVDLGDITTARGTEAYLLLWLRLWGAVGSPDFNVHVAR